MRARMVARALHSGLPVWAGALAGLLAGVTTALLMGAPIAPRATSQSPAPTSETTAARSFVGDRPVAGVSVDQRVAALEKRIEELSSARVDSPSPPASAIDVESEREASAQRHFADHAELLAKHRSEARDPGWASGQEKQLRTALDAMSETMRRSFSVQSVDCRTATCVARLTWPSETAARLDADSFMGGSGAVRCAREMAFPPAGAPGPYTASLYLDCAEHRWGHVPGDPG
jgi:hypothetical protein